MTDVEKKPKVRYDRALLDEVLKRDGATLVGEYDTLKRGTVINYICKCGNSYSTQFYSINFGRGALCKKCNRDIWVKKVSETNRLKFGVDFVLQSEQQKEKAKTTCILKYGVDSTAKVKEFRDKQKETYTKNYGGHPQKNKIVREKAKSTNLKKYGVEHTFQSKAVKEKIKATTLEKYGVEHNSQSIKVKYKKKETSLAKFGTEHPNQNPEIQEKIQTTAKKYKEFKMPSGEIRKVQGYEPFALNTLLLSYTEEQIKTDRKDVPRVDYEVGGKKRYYFPDIFLPHENKIIEVKSTWTYKCKADNVKQKADACRAKGYAFEFWVYNAKGERVELND
jgi:hypothetical protein